MTPPDRTSTTPLIGILCWEAGGSPRGLVQLEALTGNSTNPDTFPFPVSFRRIEGANIHTILENPCRKVLASMIEAARDMEARGIRAITTSCGFNAIFQRELAEAVRVPVFTSSLIQVPLVQTLLGSTRTVGVITAKRSALTDDHLRRVGIDNRQGLHIAGLEACPEWNTIFTAPDDAIDIPVVEKEVVAVARSMVESADVGAVVLECTDLPPFADAIRRTTGRPVFDFVTLTQYVYRTIQSAAAP